MNDPAAPPAWLLAMIMAGSICAFIAFLYLIQVVKRFFGSESTRPARPRAMVLRRRNGQFRGSASTVPKENDRSEVVTAPGRAVPQERSVPSLPLSVPEIARISYDLGRGIAASDIAKSLPGYSARNYKDYAERVRQVQQILSQIDAEKPPPAMPVEAHAA